MRYSKAVAYKVGVLSLVFVGMVTFNNLCLKYVEVSFYNVARSLTIVFNVMLSFAILRCVDGIAWLMPCPALPCSLSPFPPPQKIMATTSTTVSTPTLACLSLVILGFWAGADGEVNFSLVGTISGVVASLFVSLNSIYTKKVVFD